LDAAATDAPVKPALSADSCGDVIKVLLRCVLSAQSFEWLNPRGVPTLFATAQYNIYNKTKHARIKSPTRQQSVNLHIVFYISFFTFFFT
jgi:hypothetical protein